MDEKKTPEEQNKNQPLNVIFPGESITSKFCDLVHITSNSENVSLTFIQKIPYRQDGQEKEAETGEVVARVCMSWPHFYRFAKLINDTAVNNEDRVVKALNESISFFSEG